MKILIVEDEPLELRALTKLIELNYADKFNKILCATDGLDAVKKAAREKPDLLLMDINLPIMDGLQAMKEIQENQENTKFIMISAYSNYNYWREAMRNQAIDYILKPYSADTLREAVDRVITDIGSPDELYGKMGVIQSVKQILDKEYAKSWSLDNIAKRVNLNKIYLGRIFRDYTGITIMNYLKSVRLTKAKELLLKGMNVNDVALEVGIDDPSYFGRIFKQETGTSPIQYKLLSSNGREEGGQRT